ncbi:putative methyltransferase [Nicotiana attenuata]|uniref:Methyltransferase n=1 Tax=Nicotiana attenuata TaxID=49451 RepID=A0A314KZS7_NICAT|nr:putative methyltransferase [Nicotiana attenuata]
MDTSCDMVKLCKDVEQQMPNDNIETSYITGDEEYLPVKENSVDLVISCLGLHWTNDLPGAMIQVLAVLALKSDGLFLAAILGGETLKYFTTILFSAGSLYVCSCLIAIVLLSS